jgi:hypothetical protein
VKSEVPTGLRKSEGTDLVEEGLDLGDEGVIEVVVEVGDTEEVPLRARCD